MSDILDEAQKKGVVIGLKKVTGKVVNRLDIDVLLTEHPKTFNLYILALEALQKDVVEGKNITSWFSICGIHGLPLQNWDGVTQNNNEEKNGYYCTHGTVLFPTWHRPYLALMEQTIYQKMREIAGEYTDSSLRHEYLEAVEQFRLPYFDYFRPRGGAVTFPGVGDKSHEVGKSKEEDKELTSFPYDFKAPRVLTEKKLSVVRPSDKVLTEIDNPLRAFKYPAPERSIPESQWETKDEKNQLKRSRKETKRHPSATVEEGDSDDTVLSDVLNRERANSLINFFNMMEKTFYNNYNRFASAGGSSLENLHNNYHGNIGGSGHMGEVALAAFDPFFWLHHSNVDRCAAIWQKIHPSTFLAEDRSKEKLYPFRKSRTVNEEDFWNSEEAKETITFGYDYPDLNEDLKGSKFRPQDIREELARKYRWSLTADPPPKPPKDMLPIDVSKALVFQKPNTSPDYREQKPEAREVLERPPEYELHKDDPKLNHSNSDEELLAGKPEGTRVVREYSVDVELERNGLNDTFTMYYFLGDVEENAAVWRLATNLAATTHIFTAPVEHCANCEEQARKKELYRDTASITAILEDFKGKTNLLESMHPKHVLPYLQENLHWRGVSNDRDTIAPADVPGLKVTACSEVKFFYPGSLVPDYGYWTEHEDVTAGRTQ